MESTADRRKRVITFLLLTFGFSSIFWYVEISAGSIRVGGGLIALACMWCPGIAAILTQILYRRSLRELGWRWGKSKYQLWSYLVPLIYALAIHAFVWVTGLAGFVENSPTELLLLVLKALVVGTVLGCISTLGEEIGWQGFMIPLLARKYSYTKTALLRGSIWSFWHYPIILFGLYGSDELPIWYKLVCFTLTFTGVSFAFTWFRMKSGSLWTGMFMHCSHNLFLMGLPDLTTDGEVSKYFLVDEFGAVSAAIAMLVAFVFWRKRGALAAERP